MSTLDATARHTAVAGAARLRAAAPTGGRGFGMYPCATWRPGVSIISFEQTAIFTDTNSHKAWRPTEHSP
ncbi:MAG: hypothetical protein JJE52_18145 [Acidimicrobiia bacterium]|nr:hypothetical protein [Acidimicrobiia bacterium]